MPKKPPFPWVVDGDEAVLGGTRDQWRAEQTGSEDARSKSQRRRLPRGGTSNILAAPPAPVAAMITPGSLSGHGGASEESLAREFVLMHGEDWLFDYETGRWFHWIGGRWRWDQAGVILHAIVEHLRAACPTKPAMQSSRTARGVQAIVAVNPSIATAHALFDSAPMLLGTPSAVIDLASGKSRSAERGDYITKATSVAPRWTAPRLWLKFLSEATGGDIPLVAYLQRVAGYCLTGSTNAHALFFLFGGGKNGKSVFLNTVARVVGDYAVTASMDTFTASKGDRHPTDLARLDGPRLVTASETEEGRAWAESRIKQLTGGDRIAARYMRQDFFEFSPVFKLVIAGNFQPQLHNVDEAMRRRFHMIPFVHIPANPDPRLEEKLVAEHPQILAWMIEGARTWARRGLERPDAVIDASDRYFEEQDLFGHWLEECCVRRAGVVARSGDLFASWRDFARRNGEDAGTQKGMAGALRKRGFQSARQAGGTRAWQGLRLVDALSGSSDA